MWFRPKGKHHNQPGIPINLDRITLVIPSSTVYKHYLTFLETLYGEELGWVVNYDTFEELVKDFKKLQIVMGIPLEEYYEQDK